MRAVPVGIFSTVPEVLARATVRARLTHDTPDGVAAACAAALSSHYFLSVPAAVAALTESHSVSELLHRCIAFTGDVDTVAAIALAAGSCTDELVQDLPEHLVAGLEIGPYGRDYVISLDQHLMARRPGR